MPEPFGSICASHIRAPQHSHLGCSTRCDCGNRHAHGWESALRGSPQHTGTI